MYMENIPSKGVHLNQWKKISISSYMSQRSGSKIGKSATPNTGQPVYVCSLSGNADWVSACISFYCQCSLKPNKSSETDSLLLNKSKQHDFPLV